MALTLDDLLAHEEIKLLKYRYMRALDTHDWVLMESLYMPDAHCWFGNGKYSAQGRDEIITFYKSLLNDDFWSSHIAVHPEIELTSPTTAKAIWRLEDTVHYLADNPAATEAEMRAGDEHQGAGHYFDEYAKLGDDWKIQSSGYVRIYDRLERRGQRDVILNLEPQRGIKQD